MSKKGLEKLLQLSTSLQTGQETGTGSQPRQKLDPAMLDHIMGPDDATLMLQAMQTIESNGSSRGHQEIAFENLESLVEQIDNANNIAKLGLWPPILKQLGKDDAFFRRSACSVIASACQNNPKCQDSFVTVDGLERVSQLVRTEDDLSVVRKALFAITSTLRNNSAALQRFSELDGWALFESHLGVDKDASLQKRTVFFLQSLYLPGESQGVDRTIKEVFLPKLKDLLESQSTGHDEDLKEKLQETIEAAERWRAESC